MACIATSEYVYIDNTWLEDPCPAFKQYLVLFLMCVDIYIQHRLHPTKLADRTEVYISSLYRDLLQ